MLNYIIGFSWFHVMKAISILKLAMENRKSKPVIPVQTVNRSRVSVQSIKLHTEITEQNRNLDPAVIPKYVSQLVKPPAYKPFKIYSKLKSDKKTFFQKRHLYFVDICEFEQQVLPEGFPKTKVWGYGGLARDEETGKVSYSVSSPGATFEAVRGIPVMVKWVNQLTGRQPFAVDPTLHWANPNDMPMTPPKPWPPFPPGFSKAQAPVPTVTHLHGGEVPSVFDGHPDAWFTADGKKGPAFETDFYLYPNMQEAATMWYHDHSLGMTRLNVYAGLAGFYLLREPRSCGQVQFPEGRYEIPIVIQDRSFQTDGSLLYSEVGINPEVHPYWVPGFAGNTIMVNGKIWPNLNVERRQYRFRLLNGSNTRFYNLKLSNGMSFIQIGTDGGFLEKPVKLKSLLIAPAERADILVDFSNMEPGNSIILLNDANFPYPNGAKPAENTVGQIMRFAVPADCAPPVKPPELPCLLNDIVSLRPDSPRRILTLDTVAGPGGLIEFLQDGQKWHAPVSEVPMVGSTEEWVLVNLTGGTHPIHLHLVQFQIKNHQELNAAEYKTKWQEINGLPPLHHPTEVLPVEPYLIGEPIPPAINEKGWKDTVKVNPNQVTRILARFAPQNVPVCKVKPGENLFPFDPSLGPGYVWHCHVIDHEDNEMMRPMKVES